MAQTTAWKKQTSIDKHISIGSMGLVYLPTWIVDLYGNLVGKYVPYIDPMGIPCMEHLVCPVSSASGDSSGNARNLSPGVNRNFSGYSSLPPSVG